MKKNTIKQIVIIFVILAVIGLLSFLNNQKKYTNNSVVEEAYDLPYENIQGQINKRAQEYHFSIKTKDTFTTEIDMVDCNDNQIIKKGEEVFLQTTDGWGGSQLIHVGGIGFSETRIQPKEGESVLLCGGGTVIEFFAIEKNKDFPRPGQESEIGSPVEFINGIDQSSSTIQIGNLEVKGFIEKRKPEDYTPQHTLVVTDYAFTYKNKYYSFHKYQYENIDPNDPKKANKELFTKLADEIFDSLTFF